MQGILLLMIIFFFELMLFFEWITSAIQTNGDFFEQIAVTSAVRMVEDCFRMDDFSDLNR